MEVLELSSLLNFAPGDIIFHEGDPGDSMFIIRSGEVEVIKQIGGQAVIITRLGPDGIFGEMALLEGQHRSATVAAVTEVSCHVIGGDVFRAKWAEIPPWMQDLYELVVDRLRITSRKYNPHSGRIPAFQIIDVLTLLMKSSPGGGAGTVSFPWEKTVDRMRYLFDIPRSQVQIILETLVESSFVETDFDAQVGKLIKIDDSAQLEKFEQYCRDENHDASEGHFASGNQEESEEYDFLLLVCNLFGGNGSNKRVRISEIGDKFSTRLGKSLAAYQGVIERITTEGIWATTDDNSNVELDLGLGRERIKSLRDQHEFPWLASKLVVLSQSIITDTPPTGSPKISSHILEGLTGGQLADSLPSGSSEST